MKLYLTYRRLVARLNALLRRLVSRFRKAEAPAAAQPPYVRDRRTGMVYSRLRQQKKVLRRVTNLNVLSMAAGDRRHYEDRVELVEVSASGEYDEVDGHMVPRGDVIKVPLRSPRPRPAHAVQVTEGLSGRQWVRFRKQLRRKARAA